MRKYNPSDSEVFIDETGKVTFKYVQEDNGPCWPGYKQVGTKMKNGKEVPNCVPIDEYNEKVNIQKALKKVKGLTKDQMQVLMSIPTPALTSMINQLGMLVNSTDEEVNETIEEARIPMYKKTKFEGKKFDRKKEIKSLKNMQKALHKLAKMQDDMQYTAETGGTSKDGNPHAIYQALVDAEWALFAYMGGIERGKWDGIIDMDRD